MLLEKSANFVQTNRMVINFKLHFLQLMYLLLFRLNLDSDSYLVQLALAMEVNEESEHHLMIEKSASPIMLIDPRKARFPCCIVWTPIPVISWLIPFIGHIGICREDGVILDFAGPNFVCVDNFAFGAVARYFQINKEKVYLSTTILGPSLF